MWTVLWNVRHLYYPSFLTSHVPFNILIHSEDPVYPNAEQPTFVYSIISFYLLATLAVLDSFETLALISWLPLEMLNLTFSWDSWFLLHGVLSSLSSLLQQDRLENIPQVYWRDSFTYWHLRDQKPFPCFIYQAFLKGFLILTWLQCFVGFLLIWKGGSLHPAFVTIDKASMNLARWTSRTMGQYQRCRVRISIFRDLWMTLSIWTIFIFSEILCLAYCPFSSLCSLAVLWCNPSPLDHPMLPYVLSGR